MITANEHWKIEDVPKTEGTVFISGSRSLIQIPKNVIKSLDIIRAHNLPVLLSDSEKGVEREIAEHFRRPPVYNNVTLYTAIKNPRIRFQSYWDVQYIGIPDSITGRERQVYKDRLMIDQADWGLIVMNPVSVNAYGNLQASSESLRNAIQLLMCNKPVRLFYLYESRFYERNLYTIKDLREVMLSYYQEHLTRRQISEIFEAKNFDPNQSAGKNKARTVLDKIDQLLAEEMEYRRERNRMKEKARLEQQVAALEKKKEQQVQPSDETNEASEKAGHKNMNSEKPLNPDSSFPRKKQETDSPAGVLKVKEGKSACTKAGKKTEKKAVPVSSKVKS